MTPEAIIGISLAAAAPITMAIFRLLPPAASTKSAEERRHALVEHDHNGRYMSRNEFVLHQQNTELLAQNLRHTTEMLAEGIGKDIAEIKQRIDIWDEHMIQFLKNVK
ncbi:hypothetical protein M0R04_09170 [Candidatus Dojkabacteria bacterium]|jgi:hypothetical protein|nr:hypothetical protein [Candidatus Dojkabacteria bacterium]